MIRPLMMLVFTIAGLALAGFLLVQVYNYVQHNVAYSAEPPKVVLKNRPAWMTDLLYAQICRAARPSGAHSSLNSQTLLQDTALNLKKDPRTGAWIKQIHQIRLIYDKAPGDTLLLDCEFRAPLALVKHSDDYYYLVDGEGIALPERYKTEQVSKIVFTNTGAINLRIVQGLAGKRPLPGEQWEGQDLAAALDMAKILYGQPFAEEILTIDVSNFQGRKNPHDAHLVLMTQRNTQIRWGRPANSTDYLVEVPPAQKLRNLQAIYQQYHRVDAGHAWVDLRFDRVTYPTTVNNNTP